MAQWHRWSCNARIRDTRKLRFFVAQTVLYIDNSRDGPASSPVVAAVRKLEQFADDHDENGLFEAWEASRYPRPGIALATVAGGHMHAQMMAKYPMEDVRHFQAGLMRELLGNPWEIQRIRVAWRVELWQRWYTPTVRQLAQVIYDERRWDELPIMADALEEAGCDNVDILNHLRGREWCLHVGPSRDPGAMLEYFADTCPFCMGDGWRPLRGPHCRGCWVVDTILGKE